MAKKILIIDDDATMQEALSIQLKDSGFEVLGAGDGEEGLAVIKKEKPDLVLLDIVMPNMDGLTMLRKLREESWGKKVPVMILTVLEEEEKVQAALEGGAHDFLLKGEWKPEDITAKVKKKLEID